MTESTTRDCLIQDLFFEQAARAPERPAVISSGRTLSYAELAALARGIGARLRSLGVRPNTLVAIVMDKGWEQIAAVLGTLAAGAAYLPIDSSVPEERLAFLLENGEVDVVLTQSWLEEKLHWPSHPRRISVDRENFSSSLDSPSGSNSDNPLPRLQTADDAAYVLYTSGSTGQPKGVMIAHRGLVNCIVETNREFQVGPSDRALAVTALHHDMSVYDIFGLLAAGGAIVIPDRDATRSPDHWVELIARHAVTIWNSVPAFMEMLLVHAAAEKLVLPNRLRLAFLGGDWIPLSAPGRIRAHFGDAQVVSVGGPTETTVWNIWYPVDKVQPGWNSIPYGHAIPNARYHVLDERQRDCPPGEPGELCCSGVGLLKGYWRNDEQTRARTAIHSRTGERIYRTGDRGRFLPDGEIEFLGRIDRQVKINGQRIELGEIEATLLRQPGVKQAVADAIEFDGHKKIVAYIVPEAAARANSAAASGPAAFFGELSPSDSNSGSRSLELTTDGLRAAVERFLPAYMVPSSFMILESLPLNANGKVDRSQLPAAVLAAASAHKSSAQPGAMVNSQTTAIETSESTEKTIASVWKRLLGAGEIRPADNFFDLGGDSILLVEAHAELQRTLKRKFSVTDLFQFPSVRALSAHLDGQASQVDTSDIAERMRKQRSAMAKQRKTKAISQAAGKAGETR